MPKFARKNRLPRTAASRATTRAAAADDVMSIDDGVSTCSNVSDGTSNYDDVEAGVSVGNEIVISSDNLEEKLDTSIEGLRSKDLKTRETTLRTLNALFSQKYIPDLVSSRKESLVEQLIACLKKGTESEGKLAAVVTSLFIIQFGEQNDELYQRFRDAILPVLRDETKPAGMRTSFAQTIGVVSFVCSEEITSSVELMKSLEAIFAKSYLLGDGSSPVVTRDQQELHAAALSSWCLLMSTMPTNIAHELIRIYVPEKLPGLIESSDADLRNQAGETICVAYEIAREINSIFADPPDSLLERLQTKANESAKYKGKKEKRLQRATFREIYNSFEEGTSPEFDIKFARETLQINSWTGRLYYNVFSGILATGMNVHLKDNSFLRSVFGLDAHEADNTAPTKGNRFERQLANKAAFKVRTQALKKTRANKSTRTQVED